MPARFSPIGTPVTLNRRRFVQGLAAGGVLAGLPGLLHAAADRAPSTVTAAAPVLRGTEIDLVVAE